MGRDKAILPYRGRPAIAWVAEAARDAGAERVMVAGGDYGLPFVADPVPYGGPLGGVLAAAAAMPEVERLLVLAVDAPALLAADLEPLLTAPAPGAAYAGQPLPMVIVRTAIPSGLSPGAPLRRLVEAAGLGTLACPPLVLGRLQGANTPAEHRALEALSA